jgi:hypothetical protein
MNSHTDDLIINEETNENDDAEEEDEDDDPFSMAVKELSETNRQANEIARVRIFFCDSLSNIFIEFNQSF